MAGFGLRTMKWSYNRLKSRDVFKQTISLTYKGKESYSMVLGGICSTLMIIGLTIFGITLAIRMYNRTDVEWNQNISYVDQESDYREITVKESDKLYLIAYFDIKTPNWTSSNKIEHLFAALHSSFISGRDENGVANISSEIELIKETS